MSDRELDILRARVQALEAENAQLRDRHLPSREDEATSQTHLGAHHRLDTSSLRFGLWLWNMTTDQQLWSPALYDICGLDHAEPARMERFVELLHPDDRPEVEQRLADARGQQRQEMMDMRLIHPDGRLLHLTGGGATTVQGDELVMIGTLIDRTDEVHLRERLERTVVQLSELVRLSGAATWKLSRSGDVEWSPELRALLDYGDDVPPSTDAMLARVHPEDLPPVAAALDQIREGKVSARTMAFRLMTGARTVHVLAGLRPLDASDEAFAGTFLDVTEHSELSTQLERAHRLEPLARFATGLAHDVNNALTVIGTAAGLLKQDLPDNGDVDLILEACKTASNITRELLSYARAETSSPRGVDLSAELEPILRMGRSLLEETVTLSVLVDENLPQVHLDPVQLQQVVLNVLTNARDATTEDGRIQIRAARALGQPPVDKRPGVELVITDDGEGMDGDTLRRCREPFFSTKTAEHGTGLGLAMCEALQRQVGGRLDLVSAPGAGTTVRLWWPEPPDEHAAAPVEEESTTDRRLSIVLVDDDPQVRRAVQRLLENHGHRVRTAASPTAALRMPFDKHDVLVTDRVMPQMSSIDLIRQLRSVQQPTLKAVVMSAHGPGDLDLEDVEFVAKPFQVEQLLDALLAPGSTR